MFSNILKVILLDLILNFKKASILYHTGHRSKSFKFMFCLQILINYLCFYYKKRSQV